MAESTKSGNWFQRHKVWSVVLAIVVIAIIGSAMGSPKTETNTNTAPAAQQEPAKQEPAATKVTSQQIYDQTQVGMTKDQVVAIAGKQPDNCIDSEIAGLGVTSTCSYGTASISFLDGKVQSKTKL